MRDSIATIYLHNNMLEYGHTYYVTIDNGVLNLADGSFKESLKKMSGLSLLNLTCRNFQIH